MMRSRAHVEEGRGERRSIVLTAIPYQVGKNDWSRRSPRPPRTSASRALATFATDHRAGRSDRHRIEARRDRRGRAQPIVASHLPRPSFPANMLAIRGGGPRQLALRDIIESFVKFREEVITRRSKFELLKARERAHILLGLVVAVTHLDEVVKMIRGSASPAAAREKLLEREWMPTRSGPTSSWSKRSRRRPPGSPIACPKRR